MSDPVILGAPEDGVWEGIWMGIETTPTKDGWFPVQWNVSFNELSIFEKKLTLGAITKDSDDIISSLIMSDWSGGGQIDLLTGADQSRYRHGVMDAEKPGAITLPLYVQTLTPSHTGSTYPACQIGDYPYVIRGTKVFSFNENTDAFGDSATVTTTPVGKGTMFNGKVYFPLGSTGYARLAESAPGTPTWTETAGVNEAATKDATSSPNAVDFEVWDDKIWALTPTGVLAYSFTGTPAEWKWDQSWNEAKARFNKLESCQTPKQLVTFVDNNGDPCLMVISNSSGFRADFFTKSYEKTPLQFAPHPDFGTAACVWRPGEDLKIAAGLGIISFSAANVVDPLMGLSRGDGLPYTNLGRIADLVPEASRLFAFVSGATAGSVSYDYGAQVGTTGTGNGQFTVVRGLATDSSGNVWAADTQGERIEKFTNALVYSSQDGSAGTGNNQFATDDGAWDIAIDSANSTWHADRGNHRITKRTSGGSWSMPIDGRVSAVAWTLQNTYGSPGTGTNNYDTPGQVALDASTNSYVADTGNKRIIKRNSSGVYQSSFQSSAITDWETFATVTTANGLPLTGSVQMAVDASGNSYIADATNARLVKLDSSGTYVASQTTGLEGICGVCTDPAGNVYCACNLFGLGQPYILVFKFDSTFTQLWRTTAVLGVVAGELATDGTTLWVTDTVPTGGPHHGVRSYACSTGILQEGAFIFEAVGSLSNQLGAIPGISYNANDGLLYLRDASNSRIKVYSTSGTYQRLFSTASGVTSVAVDGSGALWLAEPAAGRLRHVSSTGTVLSTLTTPTPTKVARGVGDVLWTLSTTGTLLKWDEVSAVRAPKGVAVSGTDIYLSLATGTGDYLAKYNSAFTQQWAVECPGVSLSHLATDGTHLYTCASDNTVRKHLLSTGAAVSSWGSAGTGNGQFNAPTGIVYDSVGLQLWIVDAGNARVQRCDTSGTYLGQFATGPSARGIAVDSAGRPIVAGYGDAVVTRYTTAGAVVDQFSRTGADGIAVSTGDVLWVTSASASTLTTWDEVLGLTAGSAAGKLSSPKGLAIHRTSGRVYVADTGNMRVQYFDSAGALLGGWGSAGTGSSQFGASGPTKLAVNQTSGDVYVLDPSNMRVQQFTSTGSWLRSWGSSGSEAGQFLVPSAIATSDITNEVFVGDGSRGDVQVFTASGTYTRKFGSTGSGNGQFQAITGITLSQVGTTLYAADATLNRVQSFAVTSTSVEQLALPYVAYWTGSGWHGAWELNDNTKRLTWAGITATSHAIDGYRLWWGCTDGNVYSLPLRRTFHSPREGWKGGYDRFSSAGYLISSRFDSLMAGFDKKASRLVVYTDTASPTETMRFRYRYDTELPWENAYDFRDSAGAIRYITTPGKTILPFGVDSAGFSWGQQFNWMQFRLDFARGTNAYQTPSLVAAVLNYTKVPQQARTFRFSIPFPRETWNGRTGVEIRNSLRALLRAGQFVKLVHQDITYRGQLAAVGGLTSVGPNYAGGATVNFIEIGVDN